MTKVRRTGRRRSRSPGPRPGSIPDLAGPRSTSPWSWVARRSRSPPGCGTGGRPEVHAREIVQIIAEDRRAGRTSTPTLGQVFSVYFRYRAPLLTHDWRQAAETRRDLFEAAWGRDQRVETSGRLTSIATPRSGGRASSSRRDVNPQRTERHEACGPGTLHADFRCSVPCSTGLGSTRLTVEGCSRRTRCTTWIGQRRRTYAGPLPSHQRFVETLAKVDRSGFTGPTPLHARAGSAIRVAVSLQSASSGPPTSCARSRTSAARWPSSEWMRAGPNTCPMARSDGGASPTSRASTRSHH